MPSNLDYKCRSRIPSLVSAGIWGRQRLLLAAALPLWRPLLPFPGEKRGNLCHQVVGHAACCCGWRRDLLLSNYAIRSQSAWLLATIGSLPFHPPPLLHTFKSYYVKICQNCAQQYTPRPILFICHPPNLPWFSSVTNSKAGLQPYFTHVI
jgi:hypothetical protein